MGASILSLVIAGCGGGDGGNSDSTEQTVTTGSLTKAEFLYKANAICAHERRRLARQWIAYLTSEYGKNSDKTKDELAEEAAQKILVPALQLKIDEIRELGAPADDVKQVEAFLDGMQQSVENLEQHPATSIGELGRQLQATARGARAYGVRDCAGGHL